MAKKRTASDSVFSEPHFQDAVPAPSDPNLSPADSVWMEPGQSPEGAGKGQQLYETWILGQKAKQTFLSTWSRTLLLSLFAGPLAIFTTFFTGHPGAGILLLVVAGPLIEEIGKVLLPLMVMEKNPAKFRCRLQLILCAAAGGLVFSVIENFIYLKIYFPDAGAELIRWRWSVCVLLHTGCSLVAGMGLAKAWKESDQNLQMPKLDTAAPLMITAVVLHGIYNFLALWMNSVFE